MKVKLDKGAVLPTRAHDTDAGLDLYTPKGFLLPPDCDSQAVDTGVHIEIPHGYFGKIESKSGLNINKDVVVCGGVIDEGYTGSIVVKLYNLGRGFVTFDAGSKIAQLIIQPCAYVDLEEVDEISGGDRGDAGFGSTGR